MEFTRVDETTVHDGPVVRYQTVYKDKDLGQFVGEVSATVHAVVIQGTIAFESKEDMDSFMEVLLKCIAHRGYIKTHRLRPGFELLSEEGVTAAVTDLRQSKEKKA